MKKLLLILLCLPLFFISCKESYKRRINKFKQTKKDDITEQFKSDLKKIFKAKNKKDWNTVLDMTYPKLFDYVTKEELIKDYKSRSRFKKDVQSKLIGDIVISPIINFEGFKFNRIFYNEETLISFYNNDDLEYFIEDFEFAFGKNNIKVFSENNSFSVNIESSIVAILEGNSSKWKYIGWGESLFNDTDIIPAIVYEKLILDGNDTIEKLEYDLERISGNIKIDGSSTVYPITEALAQEFRAVHTNVRVTVGVSGTGGGFKICKK